MDDAQCGCRRARLNAHFRLMDGGQCAFGTDDELDEIEFSISYELIEVIAANTTHDLRETAIDLITIRAYDLGDSAFETAMRHRFLKLHLTQLPAFAGSEDDVHFDDVVDSFSVDNRMRTCGVVAHHPTDRCAIGS